MAEQPTIDIQRTSMLNGINFIGHALVKVGIDPFQINAKKVIKKAVKKSGYKKEIPKNIIEGLNRMVDSLNKDSNLNTFGKIALRTLLERTLYGRLKVEQHFVEHPEVEDIEIKEPVFIIGMPRTGTTILHALLEQDHYHRSPLAWECLLPYPPPRPSDYSTNQQFKTIEKEFEQLFRLVPDFRKKHYMEANSPQECLGINALDFNTFQISAQAYVPTYMDWFANDADKLGTMKFHKRFLQYLQSGGVKSERWLLKSPVHLLRLPEIFKVYPDAKVIMTHRAPEYIVPSASSLVSSVRSLYSDSEDPRRTGHEQADTWSRYFERFVDIRKDLKKEHQIIDLKFDNFIQHPMEVLSMLYDQFQWKLSEEAKRKFQIFLEANPKGKHGKHEYALKDFGLTKQEIESKFEVYIKFLKKL